MLARILKTTETLIEVSNARFQTIEMRLCNIEKKLSNVCPESSLLPGSPTVSHVFPEAATSVKELGIIEAKLQEDVNGFKKFFVSIHS